MHRHADRERGRPLHASIIPSFRRLLGRHPLRIILAACLAIWPDLVQGFPDERQILISERHRLAESMPSAPALGVDRVLREGTEGSDVIRLRAVLDYRGYPASTASEPGFFDKDLTDAVFRFQRSQGLRPDGIVGTATAERLALRPADLVARIDQSLALPRLPIHGPTIVVNIPAAEMRLLGSDGTRMSSRVIVGRPSRKTPLFSAEITAVTFNPAWHVPPGILRKDILPRLRQDPGHAERQGFDIYRIEGGSRVKLERRKLDGLAGSNYAVVQRPGPENALGRVKFEMPNPFDVYLHDTPDRHLFARDRRLLSSGCVRVEAALTLARLLIEPARWQEERIDARLAAGRTFRIALATPVPVRLEYRLAEVDDTGAVRYHPDVYGTLAHGSPATAAAGPGSAENHAEASALSECTPPKG
jgi:L,D-transpeptidase YcbB